MIFLFIAAVAEISSSPALIRIHIYRCIIHIGSIFQLNTELFHTVAYSSWMLHYLWQFASFFCNGFVTFNLYSRLKECIFHAQSRPETYLYIGRILQQTIGGSYLSTEPVDRYSKAAFMKDMDKIGHLILKNSTWAPYCQSVSIFVSTIQT